MRVAPPVHVPNNAHTSKTTLFDGAQRGSSDKTNTYRRSMLLALKLLQIVKRKGINQILW